MGPRPPLPDEVERYDDRFARRMLAKPEITDPCGMWAAARKDGAY
ncbi:hypothetical protein [Gordonia polyisoprenivorans]|nr:hypothetical protein [Gordonia polyisoprenivorans]